MAKKPTRNTTAQYRAKPEKVRYIYDAGDNRKGMSLQPAPVANEIIRVAVSVEEGGEYLNIRMVGGQEYSYFLDDFEKVAE